MIIPIEICEIKVITPIVSKETKNDYSSCNLGDKNDYSYCN
jgi:hypothetical protein